MLKIPQEDETLWKISFIATIKGIALGIFLCYLRVEFNISVGQKSGVPEEVDFTWLRLAGWVASCVALLNFLEWYRYLQENIDKEDD